MNKDYNCKTATKLDENNQYGNGVTKPLPAGCIKDSDGISWKTFNFFVRIT